jgi:hypothetical protein
MGNWDPSSGTWLKKQISNLQNVSQMRMKKMVFASNLFECRRDFSGY